MQIRFEYDQQRATQAVLWLLHKHGGQLDILKLLKLMFFVDRLHLARYGRPTVGGRYFAMQYGPVASELYDAIKAAGAETGEPYVTKGNQVIAVLPLDENFLSESDIGALEEVDREFGHLDPFRLSDITHNLKVWSKNNPGGKTSAPIPYEDFFLDMPDDSMLDIIREDQEAREILE